MGLNFYYHDGLQPRMGAGIINDHECKFIILGRIPEPYPCIREFQTEKKIFQTNQHTKHKEFNDVLFS